MTSLRFRDYRTFSRKQRRKSRLPGLWIVLYGPDGAGKSAAAQSVAEELLERFRTSHRYHLRVNLRPRGRPHAPVTRPHAVTLHGPLAALLKVFYLLGEYWMGFVCILLPQLAAGHLVIFDRYFHDHLVDPMRYRLPRSSRKLLKLVGQLVPRPQLQFVLDVRADELQRRKCEVPLAESQRQRREYIRQFSGQPNTFVVNGNLPVPEVAHEITRHILEFLQPQSQKQVEALLVRT